MTGRALLLQDLQEYERFWSCADTSQVDRYRQFVQSSDQCCHRSHLAGHCTGSAFVSSPSLDRVLLLYHPFLKRWLQPGGHADGQTDLLDVARREAHEETGLSLEELLPAELEAGRRIPFDLDIHPIPARKSEPEHFHYDLRFLLLADPGKEIIPEKEDMPVEWLSLEQVEERTDEESVLRMVRKLRSLRSGSSLTSSR